MLLNSHIILLTYKIVFKLDCLLADNQQVEGAILLSDRNKDRAHRRLTI